MKPTKPRKTVLTIALIVTIIGIGSLLWLREERVDAADQEREQVVGRDVQAVAFINGAEIDEREFQLFLQAVKAQVASYFQTNYHAEASPTFWTEAYSGEVPLTKAKQIALEKLTEVKVKQLIAHKRGLLADPGYLSFLDALKKENQRRQEAVRQHRVIYGPQQYDAWGYYTYLLSNLELRIKDSINEAEGTYTDRRQLDERFAALVKQELESVKVVIDETSYSRIRLQ
ncbi:hypothetical protein LOZ80_36395 [Paenibacillus sp. HWE-109]|uniref:hypothetical protein n=1 Tax=Paenibacillus sp. HWE-109 TaxID=1306526 RepID=UPI001EE10AAE|nr:hypothetical protein [Paenibacillus sp. HWE-109]UKS26884.1 hypothetical protein LOZ80_36395 [Paenibacillus sp. HWE-109]